MKVLTIVGARPQFIKAAVVSRALIEHGNFEERIIHTGQHYDPEMSKIFFDDLGIPAPYKNLQAGSGRHGAQTGKMLEGIEDIMIDVKPDWVLVYGDTTSTLAGALAASKLHYPVAHVEAGLRSFNRRMPEEVNRVLTDHISARLYCPTSEAIKNLKNEGITEGVMHVGDVMCDSSLFFAKSSSQYSSVLRDHDLEDKEFFLMTLHRAENTGEQSRLDSIFSAIREISRTTTVVLPLHPSTRAKLDEYGMKDALDGILVIPPVSFFDMIELEKQCKGILTDSGGVQKEAYFFRKPCITLRDETEWVETIEAGWNRLAGADRDKIVSFAGNLSEGGEIKEYGTGNAGELIARNLAGR